MALFGEDNPKVENPEVDRHPYGLFLIDRGYITYDNLESALSIQRSKRVKLGESS
jgi:hypothetical protein